MSPKVALDARLSCAPHVVQVCTDGQRDALLVKPLLHTSAGWGRAPSMCASVCSGTAGWERLSAPGSFKTGDIVVYNVIYIVPAVPTAPAPPPLQRGSPSVCLPGR